MTCGPTSVQAKPFTEWEWNNIRPYVGLWENEDTPNVDSLAARIEATMCQGFAPDEPTELELLEWAHEIGVRWDWPDARPTASPCAAATCIKQAGIGFDFRVDPGTGLTRVWVSDNNRENRLQPPVWSGYDPEPYNMAMAAMTKAYKIWRSKNGTI